MDLGLKDKVAVITGGSRGIGKACAKELLNEGAIAFLVSKSPDSNAAAVREFEKTYPGRVIGIPTDVNDDAAIGVMTEQVIARFGRIDILINAAATVIPRASWTRNSMRRPVAFAMWCRTCASINGAASSTCLASPAGSRISRLSRPRSTIRLCST
jgi:NAD(P)-dependent dehydrogenase (short-subunit alcohol dehydrogenase family)